MIAPNTPHIFNVILVSADTEYSQVIPDHTKKIEVYAVDSNKRYPHGDCLKLTFASGASDQIIVAPNSSYKEEDINLQGKTLYVQSPTGGNAVVVILCWT